MKKTVDFCDVYDYYYIPFWQTSWFVITIAMVTVCIIVCCVVLWLRRKPKNASPWEWALQELTKLAHTKCNNKEDYKRFYFALSDIVKAYLHKRYSWNTRDKTDPELIEYLKLQQFDPHLIESLEKIGQEALFIKFANVEALKSQAEEDLQAIRTLIGRTRMLDKK